VIAGELSPMVTGIVFCNLIALLSRRLRAALCAGVDRGAFAVVRAPASDGRYNGLCLVHRAEIMQSRGAWEQALQEARRAAERFAWGVLNELACGQAHYRQGEVYRLRGSSMPPRTLPGGESVWL
jgi:hypothetical protein